MNNNCKQQIYDADYESGQKITIAGEPFAIFWTDHAKERADERAAFYWSAEQFLRGIFDRIEKHNSDVLKDRIGYVAIRDYPTRIFAVVHIDRDSHRVRVVTYGDLYDIYPRIGDYVVQCNHDGTVISMAWEFHGKKNKKKATL